jgi:hypothetical protein
MHVVKRVKYAHTTPAGHKQTHSQMLVHIMTFAGAIMDDTLIACIVMAVALDFFIRHPAWRENNLCVYDVTILAVGKRCRSNANTGAMRV